MGADEAPDDGSAAPEVVGAPFAGVDHEEWDELIGRGRKGGAVHAEDVAHVLRHVELTSDVLVEVHEAMTGHGITIDVEVEQVDDTPPAMTRRRGRGASG